MDKNHRYKYEMLGRTRDYGKARRELFPESSTGGKLFARVAAAVAAVDAHLKDRVLGRAEARRVKAATRSAVYKYMKTLAQAARRIGREEAEVNPFRLPRSRTLTTELATARAFLEAAAARQEQFQYFALPATFISDFSALVDDLQRLVDLRQNSKTVRGSAQAGIRESIADGLDAVHDLDVVVGVVTEQDPVAWAAWRSARRIEGQRSGPSRSRSGGTTDEPAEVSVPGVTPPAAASPAETSPVAGSTPAASPAPAATGTPLTLEKAS